MGNDHRTNRFAKDRFYQIVGDTIRAAREAESLTRQELADRTGLHHATICHAEEGLTCSLLVMTRIADALDTTIDALVPTEALS